MSNHEPGNPIENQIKDALVELRLSGDGLADSFGKVRERQGLSASQTQAGRGTEDHKELLRRELNLVFQDIREYSPPADVLSLVPAAAAHKYGVLPLDLVGKTLKVAMVDPTDLDVIADLHLITGLRILPITSDRGTIDELVVKAYKSGGHGSVGAGGADNFALAGGRKVRGGLPSLQDGSTPVIRLVNEIITEAINSGVSDIHMEPFEREMKVRFRHDGVLHVHRTINSRSMAEVISRVKIMASLDIAEKRRPQDGRIRMEGAHKAVDMRISTLPTDYGEKIVIRILDKSAVALDLMGLGLDKKGLAVLTEQIQKPYGMILVTGPTGSGKSTTLYSALSYIKSPDINISTVEDPIEQKIEGIVQTAVRADLGVTFAKSLRTLLRQDPNVIMVGEIRDEETAQMAIRAALTGHLMLSTLHTNDAPSTVSRLLDMGMEPFLVASSLSLVMAQRLVRKVCGYCAEEVVVKQEGTQDSNVKETGARVPELEANLQATGVESALDREAGAKLLHSLGLENQTLTYKQGKGCGHCHHTGYRGRIGLFELMPVSEAVRSLITQKQGASVIREQALKDGMLTLRQDGIHKIKAGITTPDEVLRETT